MKERAGKKKVVLELGGNAGVIVDRTADIDWAVKRSVVGAFAYSGQVCISVQRMFVHEDVWDEFMGKFVAAAAALRVGDPADPADRRRPDGRRGERRCAPRPGWTRRRRLGGKVLLGGTADGQLLRADDPHRRPGARQGLLERGVRAARRRVPVPRPRRRHRARSTTASSGSRPGVFTNDLAGAWASFDELEVGGVILNDVPTYRIDHMPYGGVKDSGLGREGLRWAIEDMTEIRIMVLAWPQ